MHFGGELRRHCCLPRDRPIHLSATRRPAVLHGPKHDAPYPPRPACVRWSGRRSTHRPAEGLHGDIAVPQTEQWGVAAYAGLSAVPSKPLTTMPSGSVARPQVMMPQISLGTWQYNDTVAADAIKKGMSAGFTHIDTAENYRNQVGVGKALKTLPRDSFFLTTKTTPYASVRSVHTVYR